MSLPKHFRKPRHRKAVVATDRGWEVAETGELLVSYRGLADALRETVLTTGISVVDNEPEVTVDEVVESPVADDEQEGVEGPVVVTEIVDAVIEEPVVVEEPTLAEVKPKRKPGRPRKNPIAEQK